MSSATTALVTSTTGDAAVTVAPGTARLSWIGDDDAYVPVTATRVVVTCGAWRRGRS